MNMEQKFLRMTDKAHKPAEDEIMGFIGEQAKEAWLELEEFIKGNYDRIFGKFILILRFVQII